MEGRASTRLLSIDVSRLSITRYLFPALAVAFVIFRSLVWVLWEQSYFDSDQAIYGLMAKHLAEGRAFPVFMYAQAYMLSVESWLAAPLFVLFGSSVWALKLPLLAMNIAIALLLIRILTRNVGLARSHAFAASLFFVAASPITSSRLVESTGGNIEPLLYAVLLWLVRRRPVAFGLLAGVGVMHREFTWYAVAAVLLLEGWSGGLWTRRRVLDWLTSAAALAAVALAVTQLAARADVLGPGTAGAPRDLLVNAGAHLCVGAGSMSDLTWVITRNLSVLFGWRSEQLSTFNVTSRLTTGHGWTALPLGGVLLLAVGTWVGRVSGPRGAPGSRPSSTDRGAPAAGFPAYLVLVGAQAVLAFAFASCEIRDLMLIRYTLLAIFVAVGAVAWLLRTTQSRRVRGAVVAAVFLWASASMWDHGRLLAEYVRQPPPNRARQLIGYLDSHDIRFGRAPYWTAYLIDFLSDERIILDSTDLVRVEEYRKRVRSAEGPTVSVTRRPCTDEATVRLQDWCIENLEK